MVSRHFIPQAEWANPQQQLGLAGERHAAAYLTSCGWSIEAHRFRLGRYDLDLIARLGGMVAFVEVKTRRSFAKGAPLEAVGPRKRERLGRVAQLWRLRFGRVGDLYRFDLIAITANRSGGYSVEHVADAWRLGEW